MNRAPNGLRWPWTAAIRSRPLPRHIRRLVGSWSVSTPAFREWGLQRHTRGGLQGGKKKKKKRRGKKEGKLGEPYLHITTTRSTFSVRRPGSQSTAVPAVAPATTAAPARPSARRILSHDTNWKASFDLTHPCSQKNGVLWLPAAEPLSKSKWSFLDFPAAGRA